MLPLPPVTLADSAVLTALGRRHTTREISDKPLPPQLLANLLWAATGVNRPHGPFGAPGRTAASASNSQEVELFVALSDGAFRYDPQAHSLLPLLEDDVRQLTLTPGQRGVDARAPVVLIYVVDLKRLEHTQGFDEPGLHNAEVQKAYYYVDTGLIAANVHLFAAEQGLAAWFHNCNRAGLTLSLGLRPGQKVLFAQSVGYPINA